MALTVLSVSALVSAACASTSVNRILADPSRYRDREVRVSGSVVDSYSPIVAPTGSVMSASSSGWCPTEACLAKARVTVKGTIRERFNLGSLGDRINLPAVGSGLVTMESSRKAGN